MKPLKKMSFAHKPTFLMIFLKCFSTLNAPCHCSKKKFMPSDRGKTLQKKWQKCFDGKNHYCNEGFCRVKAHIAQNMFENCEKNIGKSFHFLMHFSWNAKTHVFSDAICSGCSHFGKIDRFRGWFSAMIYRYKYHVFSIDYQKSTFLYRFFWPPQLTMQKQRFKNATENHELVCFNVWNMTQNASRKTLLS